MLDQIETLKPHIYQEQALEAIDKSKQADKNKFVVVLPSGIGKTYLSAFETKQVEGKILYIVHRGEIINQAKKVFQKIHGINESDIGDFNGKKKQIDKKITFAMIQTISKPKNLKLLSPELFDYIILDEWHHVAAHSYKKVLSYFKPKYLLGMTATPYRLDGKDIFKQVNSNIPYQMELKDGISSGLLVPFIYHGLWDDVDYSDIKWQGHRYKESDLNKKLLIDARDEMIINEVKTKIGSRKCIGFCCSVKHVKRCVEKFNKAGIASAGIYYKTKSEERKQIINDFVKGGNQIIFTRDIFNEGVDFPDVEGLLFLRPTYSKTVFFQQLGRGLRTKEGKQNVIVLDFIGNYVSAYKIRHWLETIVSTGKKESYFKPEYNYNVPEVHFNSRVIDLFEMQEPPTKAKLIEDYYRVKEILKRQLLYTDFCYTGHVSKYSAKAYENYFGSWSVFLHSIGEHTASEYPLKEQVIAYYAKLKKELGRSPKQRDCKEINHKTIQIRLKCKSWREARKKLDDEIKEISLNEIKAHYSTIKKQIGRIPTQEEYDKFSKGKVGYGRGALFGNTNAKFNSYRHMIKKLGEWEGYIRQFNIHSHLSKSELLRRAKIFIKEKDGHISFKAFYNDTGIAQHTIEKQFGSWNNFISKAGGEVKIFKHSERDLIDSYMALEKKLGKQPNTIDIDKQGHPPYVQSYRRCFGSWQAFLNRIEKERAIKPIPPLSKDRGILGVIL